MTDSKILFAPGPVQVPEFVWEAIKQAPVHHRSADFADLMSALQSGFKYFFQTEASVIPLAGPGTFGVEMAMKNLLKAGQKVLLINFGKFSARWETYARSLDLEVECLDAAWGEVPDRADLNAALKKNFDAVVLTHCETSTGTTLDLEEWAFAIREALPEVLLIVDSISTAGAIPFYMDAWKIDVSVAASPKALLNPAGTVFLTLSAKALQLLEFDVLPDAFSLGHYWQAVREGSYPFTPPTQLFHGILAALQFFEEEGLPKIWNRTHALSQQFKAELPGLGGRVRGEAPGDSMTAFDFPGYDTAKIVSRLWSEFGIQVAGGQGPWKNEVMRIAHFGPNREPEYEKLLSALKNMLR